MEEDVKLQEHGWVTVATSGYTRKMHYFMVGRPNSLCSTYSRKNIEAFVHDDDPKFEGGYCKVCLTLYRHKKHKGKLQ